MSYQLWQDISFYLSDIDGERQSLMKTQFSAEVLESARTKISNILSQLKGGLEQKLQKDHASLVLFAIVAGIDEQMQALDYNHLKNRWTPLQKDFYSAYTAGEIFFKTIDDILENQSIPPFVYEIFYFMIKRGFQGKFRDSKTQIQKYLELLKDKIPIVSIQPKAQTSEKIAPKKPTLKAWQHYGLAALCLFSTYVCLYLFASLD